MKPYYQDDSVTLYHGEHWILPTLPERRFDACITDPPYAETSLEWDVWPEGWPEMVRYVTDCLWCFGSFRMFWDRRAEFSGWKLAQDIVWEKHNGSGLQADRFRRVHECAAHFYQGEWSALYKSPPSIPASPRPAQILRRGAKPAHMGGVEQGTGYEYGRDRIMRSVIPVPSCHGYAVNETQKPEGIVRPLVEYSVPKGGILVDLFCGSGTSLLVAKAMGRRAVGIEKRESQCEAAARRLSQEVLAL